MYRVGSFIDLSTDYGTPSLHQHFSSAEGRAGLPDPEAGVGCHVLLLQLFSKVQQFEKPATMALPLS